jgi:hypothetical protein
MDMIVLPQFVMASSLTIRKYVQGMENVRVQITVYAQLVGTTLNAMCQCVLRFLHQIHYHVTVVEFVMDQTLVFVLRRTSVQNAIRQK